MMNDGALALAIGSAGLALLLTTFSNINQNAEIKELQERVTVLEARCGSDT